jgi:phenylalanyl-tRNA synthetase beta chain
MNISYNWLKDLVEIDLSPRDLADKLTGAGLAVEGIHEQNDDFIFDIDLTSNRSDCLSHLGVSREVQALTGAKAVVNHEEQYSLEGNPNLVTIQDADLCHRFTARIIKNVRIAPSPEWLKKRLESMGERSINNVADITNYVMLELGQPMHAFDLSKLSENRIVVRRAKSGETIKTLDEVERKLDETMLMICDAEKAVAVGGIMGGFESSITNETTDVLLEVAYFKRSNIRATSRKLNLSTEASYRFERGVDIENLIRASNRATELICKLAGGECGEFADVYPTKFVPNEIESGNIQYAVKRLTGLEVENDEILRILSALGIEKKENSQIFISPSWRHDIEIEEDLVEEVARIVGYDKLGDEIPPATSSGGYQPHENRKKLLRQTLASQGFDEAISYSFIDTKHDETYEFIPNFINENIVEKFVSLQDSIIEGSTRMRQSLLSGLVEAVRTNFNHQKRDLKLFELGKVFTASENEGGLPNERELLSIVLTGNELSQNQAMAIRPFDFYDAKGAVEMALNSLNLQEMDFAAKDVKHLRKGQSAEIKFEGNAVGTIGRLNDEISSTYKFKQPVFVAEIDLQTLLEAKQQEVFYYPLPKFPSIVRDISLLAKRSLSFSEIKKEIEAQNYELLKNVGFVDVYEGKGMADDERSITIRLEYRSNQRTLMEEEVESVHSEILKNLEDRLKIKQRF